MNLYTDEAKAIFPEAREVPLSVQLDGKTVEIDIRASDLGRDWAVFCTMFIKPAFVKLNPRWGG